MRLLKRVWHEVSLAHDLSVLHDRRDSGVLAMKSRLLWIAIFSLLPATAAFGSSAQRGSTTEVRSFEEAFSSAVARNDVDALKRYLSDDWRIISSDGRVITRARFLEVVASGDLKHDTMSSQDQTIGLYGNTALVTARAQSAGRYKGVKFHTDEIGTDLLIRRQGRWVCVFTQLTTAARP
jgi:ketosteroid isomerase-like protein